MARKLLEFYERYPQIDPSCMQKCDKLIKPEANCPPCPKPCPGDSCYPSPIQFDSPPPPIQPSPQSFFHSHEKSHFLSIYLTVPLGILAAAFFLFTCYTAYKFYTYWYRSRRRRARSRRGGDQEEDRGDDEFLDEDHGPIVDHPIWYIRTVGLQPSVISAITVVKYKKGEGLVEGTDCSVCLTEFQEDEMLRLLPKCNHAFHLPCIDTWLRSHTNCPLCRAGIVIPNPPPLQEEGGENSGMVEEALIDASGSNREVNRGGIEDESSELRIGIEESRDEIGEKVNEIGFDVVQPVRRSVSFDSLSASIISAAVIKEAIAKSDVSPSIMQIGSSSVKRSASCSAKVFLSRHSRN